MAHHSLGEICDTEFQLSNPHKPSGGEIHLFSVFSCQKPS